MAIKKISANLLGNNAVTAASIAGGAISAADIANNSITAAKLSASTSPTFGGLTLNAGTSTEINLPHNGFNYIDFSGAGAALVIRRTGDLNTTRWSSNGDINLGYESTGTTVKLFWDASTERLGIGTSSPTDKLHVGTSSGGTQLKIQSGSGVNNCLLHTNGTTDSWRTGMNLALTNGSYEFYDDVNNVDRMVITSSGNVGIGTSSPTNKLEVVESSTGTVNLASLRTTGGGGQGLLLGVDTTSSYTYIKNNTSSTYGMTLWTNGAERMRILSSGGITFNGDTAAANALDDYEEGTWTATALNTGVTPAPTATGYYVKIGKRCFVNVYFAGITINSAGNAQISGLPFNADTTSNNYSVVSYAHGNMINNTSGSGQGYFSGGSMYLIGGNSYGFTTWQTGNPRYGMWSGHYDT